MLVLFHTTTSAAAKSVEESGFRDATGSYMMMPVEVTGVWLSDVPLGPNEGAKGEILLRVTLDLPESDLAPHELVEDEKPYREWCVPAALINAHAKVSRLSEEEENAARDAGHQIRAERAAAFEAPPDDAQ